MITCLQCVVRGSVAAFLRVQCRFLVGIPYVPWQYCTDLLSLCTFVAHSVPSVDVVGIFIDSTSLSGGLTIASINAVMFVAFWFQLEVFPTGTVPNQFRRFVVHPR